MDKIKKIINNHFKSLNYLLKSNNLKNFENYNDNNLNEIDNYEEISNKLLKLLNEHFKSISLSNENKLKPIEINLKNKENSKEEIFEDLKSMYKRIEKYVKTNDSLKNELIPLEENKYSSKEILFYLKSIVLYYKKKDENFLLFENEKAKFMKEFQKETEELTEKWRNFDKKKLEYKLKLDEERKLLHKELDEEYTKLNNLKNKKNKSYLIEENEFYVIFIIKYSY